MSLSSASSSLTLRAARSFCIYFRQVFFDLPNWTSYTIPPGDASYKPQPIFYSIGTSLSLLKPMPLLHKTVQVHVIQVSVIIPCLSSWMEQLYSSATQIFCHIFYILLIYCSFHLHLYCSRCLSSTAYLKSNFISVMSSISLPQH